MKSDLYTKAMLTVIAICVVRISGSLRPAWSNQDKPFSDSYSDTDRRADGRGSR